MHHWSFRNKIEEKISFLEEFLMIFAQKTIFAQFLVFQLWKTVFRILNVTALVSFCTFGPMRIFLILVERTNVFFSALRDFFSKKYTLHFSRDFGFKQAVCELKGLLNFSAL